jgi:hypothetical protein
MKKPVKITQGQLRSLINEAIQHRPAGTPEPMHEELGPWDARGFPGQETEDGMMAWNFEAAQKELFSQALTPVIDEFMLAIKEGYQEGNPDWDPQAEAILSDVAEELRTEILAVIAKKADVALDKLL